MHMLDKNTYPYENRYGHEQGSPIPTRNHQEQKECGRSMSTEEKIFLEWYVRRIKELGEWILQRYQIDRWYQWHQDHADHAECNEHDVSLKTTQEPNWIFQGYDHCQYRCAVQDTKDQRGQVLARQVVQERFKGYYPWTGEHQIEHNGQCCDHCCRCYQCSNNSSGT